MEKVKDLITEYGPYLEDIKNKIYRTAIVFAVMYFVGFSLSGPILRALLKLFSFENVVVAVTSPFQLANLSMDIGLLCAMTVSIPLIIFQFFSFASKALSSREKKSLFIYVPLSAILFLLGFAYSFIILYYSFGLLAVFGNSIGVKNIWDIGSFISQTYMTALLLGFVFQMPIVVTILVRLSVIKVDFLRKKRRIAYVIAAILVSLLPPTDGLSLIAMSLPLVLLYEVSIFINRNIK